jgi:hypothetical protein
MQKYCMCSSIEYHQFPLKECESMNLEIAVVGGGVSGAYSAWRLQQAKTEAHIGLFEYSDRIGGRLFTVTLPGLPNVKTEVGGMAVYPKPAHHGQVPGGPTEACDEGFPDGRAGAGRLNLMYRVLSNEGYQFMKDAGGYDANVANANAVTQLPATEYSDSTQFLTLCDGYDQLPITLAKEFNETFEGATPKGQRVQYEPTSSGDEDRFRRLSVHPDLRAHGHKGVQDAE